LKEARIPPRFAHTELETFEPETDSQRSALRKARTFVEHFRLKGVKGLLFYGTNGVGKTHLAIGILKRCVREKGAQAFFFETNQLLKLVRDTYNRSVEETEMEVLRPILGADLLVLDDLGREQTSPWVHETLGLVIDTRYNDNKATILTSNLADLDQHDPRSFIFQIGVRSRSRLKEMCDWVEVQGPDRREVGPEATAERIGDWKRTSPASPDNLKKSGLPEKTRGRARASLRQSGPIDLKWTGGKAGTNK
jgi:DNA replication protein DnaC